MRFGGLNNSVKVRNLGGEELARDWALRQQNLNCREIPPPLSSKYAKHAGISRLFAHKPDCREGAAREQWGRCPGFSPEAARVSC